MTVYSIKKILRESFWLLTICIIFEILAGQILNSREDIISIPALLAAVPVINGVGGNIGSILGAKLTSGLHVGYVRPKFSDKAVINIFSSVLIFALLVFAILSVLMLIFLPFSGISMDIPFVKFFIVVFIAGLILTIIISIMGVFSAFITFKRGFDPDNVVTPIITTSGDTIGITIIIVLSLLIMI